MLEHAGVETVLDAQADDVEQSLVAHVGRAHAGVVDFTLAAVFEIGVGGDYARRWAVAPVVLGRRPRVDVAVLGSRTLLTLLLPRDDRVAGNEHLQRRAGGVI